MHILLESGPANLCFLFFFVFLFCFLFFCFSNFLNLHFCYSCPSHLALLLGLLAPHISLSLSYSVANLLATITRMGKVGLGD